MKHTALTRYGPPKQPQDTSYSNIVSCSPPLTNWSDIASVGLILMRRPTRILLVQKDGEESSVISAFLQAFDPEMQLNESVENDDEVPHAAEAFDAIIVLSPTIVDSESFARLFARLAVDGLLLMQCDGRVAIEHCALPPSHELRCHYDVSDDASDPTNEEDPTTIVCAVVPTGSLWPDPSLWDQTMLHDEWFFCTSAIPVPLAQVTRAEG